MSAPTPDPDRETTANALRHLGVVALTLAFLVVLTYIVPPFHRFRPWTPGDAWPLSSLFRPAEELYAFAGVGSSDGEEVTEADREAVAEELGAAVAASLSPEEESAPREDDEALRVDPREYADLEVSIEDPTGRGMAPFYAQLARTARGQEGAITRVGHWGDSSIATDLITHTVRRRLQRRFGDAGHGWLLVARGYLSYRHRDVEHRASDAWTLREITRNHLVSSGLYGYGGIQYRGRPGAWARFGTAEEGPVGTQVSRFRVFYQRHRRGGHLHLKGAGGERRVVETRQEETEDAVETIEVPDGAHTLELRFGGHGQPRVYGVVLEREGPGVVYDSLGLVGARAARLLNYDAEHIAGQIRMRGTHLVVLGFGGNEADDNISTERYLPAYREVIRRMRAGREDLGCLVFSPLDQGTRERGRVVTMDTIPTIVEAQREAAFAEGCAFYDTFQAMGGEGAVRRWLRSRPRLASGDLRHMTPAGYEVVGNLFYKAILEGFAGYLEEEGASPASSASAPSSSSPASLA